MPGGLERTMTVRVPNVEIEKEISLRLTRVGRTAKLKGFRPGKIPAKDRGAALRRASTAGSHLRCHSFELLACDFSRRNCYQPEDRASSPLRHDDDGQFSYKATFEVYPEFELQPIEKLSIEIPTVEIEDSDVDDMIGKLRDQRADWQPVDRKAGDGDRVVADFVGKLGKEPFEGGEGRDVPIEIGAGQVISDFEKALQGMEAEQEKSAKVKFPKDYPVDTLAGKKADLRYLGTTRRRESPPGTGRRIR